MKGNHVIILCGVCSTILTIFHFFAYAFNAFTFSDLSVYFNFQTKAVFDAISDKCINLIMFVCMLLVTLGFIMYYVLTNKIDKLEKEIETLKEKA